MATTWVQPVALRTVDFKRQRNKIGVTRCFKNGTFKFSTNNMGT